MRSIFLPLSIASTGRMDGGTAPKPINELKSEFVKFMRQHKSVQGARNTYMKAKDKGTSVPRRKRRSKAAPVAKKTHVPPSPAALKNVPEHLRPWIEHVLFIMESNPSISYKEALQAASATYHGPQGHIAESRALELH